MRRALGVLLVLASSALLAVALFTGTRLGGWGDPPSSQCSQSTYPSEGGPFYESTTVRGWVTYLPLGVVCTYDVGGDAYGPQSVVHQNWPATITALVSVGFVVVGLVLVVGPRSRYSGLSPRQ